MDGPGWSPERLAQVLQRLARREAELAGVLRHADRAPAIGGDVTDTKVMAERAERVEVDDALAAQAVAGLQAVQEARRRIRAGTFGICIDCGGPIGDARLDAVPWTPRCVVCAGAADRRAAPAVRAGRPPPRRGTS